MMLNSISFRDPVLPAFLDYVNLNQMTIGTSCIEPEIAAARP